MTDTPLQPNPSADEADGGKFVPVGESIKYRRRAQQAENRLETIEQQLTDLQSQVQQRDVQLTELQQQRLEHVQDIAQAENRLAMERQFTLAGAVDMETASLLLSKRLDTSKVVAPEQLTQAVEQLLIDKPFLRGAASPGVVIFPPMSNAPYPDVLAGPAVLAATAERATQSGNRRDVAEYLRLRRQNMTL